jgi:serine/threonine-protein kinase
MAVRPHAVGELVAGKYRLEQRLGGGGMGEVYRAEHQLAGRTVALKLLHRDFAEDADLTRRFFQEAQAVNKIRHPNIVDVIDAGFSEQGPYVAMECLDGASLASVLSRFGRLEVAHAVAVVLPMLAALDAAHRHGIVHRDLKPENVFLANVGGEARVKILDFGIAKVHGEKGSPHTGTGVVFGTPDYLSPEQARGDADLDGRSDLFAVGTVLFELVVGKRPFEAPNAVATAYKIVHAPAPRLSELGVRVPQGLEDVLGRAMAKERDARFRSASSLADALAPYAPDGATRREALRALLAGALAVSPTQSAPAHDAAAAVPSLSFEVLPDVPAAPRMPVADAPASDRAVPPSAPKSSEPVAATLVSSVYAPTAPAHFAVQEPPPARAPDPRAAYQPHVPVRPGPTLASPAARMPPPSPRAPASPASPASPAPPQVRAAVGSDPWLAARMRAPASTPDPRLSGPVPRHGESGARAAVRVPEARGSSPSISDTGPRPYSAPGSDPGRRALPASARGRCKVRGTLPRAILKWVERTRGKTALAEIARALGPDLAEAVRTDGFNALMWHPLEEVDELLEATTRALYGGETGPWRALARAGFERELAPLLRPGGRLPEPKLLDRLPASWGRLFDFGAVRTQEVAPGRARVEISGIDGASAALRALVVGLVEGLLDGVPGLSVRVLTGEASFARDLVIEVTWRAR